MASQADEELMASVLEHDVAWRQAATGASLVQEESSVGFDPEGDDYDYGRAIAMGMRPQEGGEMAGHWGSVAPASDAEKQMYGLGDEAYIMLKGKGHHTWDLGVQGEEERGSRVVKVGNRYFSILKDAPDPVQPAGKQEQYPDTLHSAYITSNAMYNLVYYAARKLGNESTPGFDPVKNYGNNIAGLPAAYHGAILDATSQAEIDDIRASAVERRRASLRLEEAGLAGTAANLLAGVVDVDIALSALSDGSYIAAKMGVRTGFGMRVAQGATVAGNAAAAGMLTTAAQGLVDPNIDLADVGAAGIGGLIFGAGLGAALPTKGALLRTAYRQLDEFNGMVARQRATGEGAPEFDTSPLRFKHADEVYDRSKKEFRHEADAAPTGRPDGNIGAAQNPRTPEGSPAVHPRPDDYLTDAEDTWLREMSDQLRDDDTVDLSELRDTSWLSKLEKITGEKLGIDWYKLAYSKSPAANWLAHYIMESPTGRGGRRATAALNKAIDEDQMLGGMDADTRAFYGWVDANHVPSGKAAIPALEQALKKTWNGKVRAEFDELVYREMYRRSKGQPAPANLDPNVKLAADARELQSSVAFDIQKRSGVRGFENLDPRQAYMPLVHKSDPMMKALAANRKQDVIDLYKKGYLSEHPDLDPRIADAMAHGLVNRFLAKGVGQDMSLFNILNADGRTFLTDALWNRGVPRDEAAKIVDDLAGNIKERGTIGHAKSRNEIDITVEHNGLRLIDFVDTDYTRIWSHYARGASGASAMARAGIRSRDEFTALMQLIKRDQASIGETPFTDEFLEGIQSYFGAGAVPGGLGTTGQLMRKLTSVAYLGKLGLTQAGELGNVIAATGVENFARNSPVFSRFLSEAQRGRIDKGLLKEIEVFTGRMSEEHALHRMVYDPAEERMNFGPNDAAKMLESLNMYAGKAFRMQNHLNLFFKIQQAQRERAIEGMANKYMQQLRDGKGWTDKRAADFGLNQVQSMRLKRYIDNGTVEFTEHGVLDRLNLDKWDPRDANDFAVMIRRSMDQLVHRQGIGESGVWMHKGAAQLLTHLQTFTLTALHKQVFRNARIGLDDVSAAALIYGTLTSALAYSAKQMLDGKTNNLTAEKVAVGALNMSAITGSVFAVVDPMAAMFGLDWWRQGGFGRNDGARWGIPTVDWFNRAAGLDANSSGIVPGLVSFAGGSMTSKDRAGVTALPFANLAGMQRLWAMRSGGDDNNAFTSDERVMSSAKSDRQSVISDATSEQDKIKSIVGK